MSLKLVDKTRELANDREIAVPTVEFENDRTIVHRFKIKPGQQVGWHRHQNDYLTVQLSYGRLQLTNADGRVYTIDYMPGTQRYIEAPVEHNAVNVGDVDIEVLEIEYKK
jgi:quercetin dioxygenase-like cupin family protein